MQDTMIVAVFESEDAAYLGVTALRDMHAAGDVVVYATAVIVKEADGQISVKQAQDEGPLGLGVGALVGTMVGMIGGPAGMAIGALSGGTLGTLDDIYVGGVNMQFLNDVGAQLTSGKAAVVAEIQEGWRVPVDQRITEAGGTILRKPRVDVVEDQAAREAAARKAEWEGVKAEFAEAGDDMKAAIQGKLVSAKAAVQKTHDDAKARLASSEEEAIAKIASLKEQIQKSSDQTREKFERRIGEIEADLKTRKKKLFQAMSLTAEALSS